MRRNASLLLSLIAALVASAPPAMAGDPAAVGGRAYDPAFVDGARTLPPPPPQAEPDAAPDATAPSNSEPADGVEALLKQVRADLRGANAVDPRAVQRYRDAADGFARTRWQALGTQTRQRYADAFDRASPGEADAAAPGRFRDGSPMSIEDRALTRDPDGALRGLEAFLVPLLQDLQHAVDVKLAQPRIRR